MSSLWHGSAEQFVEHCQRSTRFAQLLADKYKERHARDAEHSQLNAWRHSLPALAAAVNEAGLTAAQVAVEYALPLAGLTVDAVVFGRDKRGSYNACIIELKQWSEVTKGKDFRFPFWVKGLPTPQRHPLTQVLAYSDYLAHCHQLSETIQFPAAAYMHQLEPTGLSWELLHNKKLMERAALFAQATGPLTQWLEQHAGNGGEPQATAKRFAEFLNGGYRPAQAFLDRMRTLFIEMRLAENASQTVASSAWELTPAQKQTVEQIMAEVSTGAPHAFVLTGKPGSGKTVVALNLVKSAFVAGHSALYATGNGGLEAVARESMQIWGHQLVKNVREFRRDVRQSVTDLLVIDESQRLWGDTHAEVDALLKRGRVVVYLLDDGQILRTDETGTRDYVLQRIQQHGIPYTHLHLNEHFRCGGGPAYIRRIEHLLGLRIAEGSTTAWDRSKYPVTILSTFAALRDQVKAWTGPADRVGLVSALTPLARKLVHEPIQVRQLHELTSFYNHRTSNNLVKAVSIYSAQGLELDYVGLIWGEDLVWRNGTWVAQTDQAETKLKGLEQRRALQLLQNRYWVLLTRAVKGLAIYCTDEETATYVQSRLSR